MLDVLYVLYYIVVVYTNNVTELCYVVSVYCYILYSTSSSAEDWLCIYYIVVVYTSDVLIVGDLCYIVGE
jgi:hypothetical protein